MVPNCDSDEYDDNPQNRSPGSKPLNPMRGNALVRAEKPTKKVTHKIFDEWSDLHLTRNSGTHVGQIIGSQIQRDKGN